MSVIATYDFKVGEPIRLALRVVSGEPSGYTFTAALALATPFANSAQTVADAQRIPFEVSFSAGSDGGPSHWIIEIAGAVTANLAPARYLVDGVLRLDGVVVDITETVAVRLSKGVS